MQYELIKARVIAFMYELVTLVISALVAMLMSPEFATAVTHNFGTGAVSSLILLFVTGLVKHLRNLKVIKASNLGSMKDGSSQDPVILI